LEREPAATLPIDEALHQLADVELPFETTVTLFRPEQPSLELTARGQGGLVDNNGRRYIVLEFWSQDQPS